MRYFRNRFVEANTMISSLLRGLRLVMIDRFASAGRNVYKGPRRYVPAMHPRLSIGYYSKWANTVGETQLSCEAIARERHPQKKHEFLRILKQEAATCLDRLDRPPAVIAWYETDELNDLILPRNGILLAVPASLRALIEDKSRFDSILAAAGVDPRVRIRSKSFNSFSDLPSYEGLTLEFGKPVVMQVRSSGGKGTYFIRDEHDLGRLRDVWGPFRVAEYVTGLSSNTTLLTVRNHDGSPSVYVDKPSVKAMGVETLGISQTKGAGNDWTHRFPRELAHRFITSVEKLGRHLYAEYGLLGLWGVDSIWSAQNVVLNEINCRNQGTTEVSGINQILRNLPPLIVAHVAIKFGSIPSWLPPVTEFNQETLELMTGTDGLAPFYLKLRVTSGKAVRGGTSFHGSGIYRLTATGRLEFSRLAFRTDEATAERDEILWANAPTPYSICLPGSELGTLEGIAKDRSIFMGVNELSAWGHQLAKGAVSLMTEA